MIGLIFVSLIVIFVVYHFYWKRRNFPPGPTPLPIIGNMIDLGMHEPGYEPFRYWKQRFGPVYTVWFATNPVVVIADYKTMKETIVKDGASYAGRPNFPLSAEIRGGIYGVVETSGDQWLQQRRFVLHQLRNFGLGTANMDIRVMGEVERFLTKLHKVAGSGPIDIQNDVDAAIGSVINNILFGYKYDESNMEEFLRIKAILTRHLHLASQPPMAILTFNLWVKHLPYFSNCHKVVMESRDNLFGTFRKQISEYKKHVNLDSETSSTLVEAFLKENKLHEKEPDQGGFSLAQLESVCFDLWIAGMETTSNTLYWSVLYVLRNEEVQLKLHEELDRVVDSDRLVQSSDKNNLHYVNATIQEVQRLANLLPVNLFHTLANDVTLNGFDLPEGTMILPQISAVMLDEKVFPDPYKFDPSRHLRNGEFIRIDDVVPFGLGKRACLGEGLARLELFLFFANFFNQFKISPVDANNLPSEKKKFGVTVKADNFSINITKRHR